MSVDTECLGIHILTDSHILHLRSDHAGTSESHLRDSLALFTTARSISTGKADTIERRIRFALSAIVRRNGWQQLKIIALSYPFLSYSRNSLVYIYFHSRIGIDTTCIVHINRCIFRNLLFSILDPDGWSKIDPAHRNPDILI